MYIYIYIYIYIRVGSCKIYYNITHYYITCCNTSYMIQRTISCYAITSYNIICNNSAADLIVFALRPLFEPTTSEWEACYPLRCLIGVRVTLRLCQGMQLHLATTRRQLWLPECHVGLNSTHLRSVM